MAAYIIGDNEIKDQEIFGEYVSAVTDMVEKWNGKFLVRGGTTRHVAGDRVPHRVVIVEFESYEHAQACIDSPEYVNIADLRDRSSVSTTIIVDGV